MIAQEEWRDIPGYVGDYQASSRGRVRSLTRRVELNNKWAESRWQYGRVLKAAASGTKKADGTKDTRLAVSLRKDGKSRTLRVHILVALAFLGPRPEALDVAHNNGDNTDNRVENLRYATHSENEMDKYRHGTKSRVTHCKSGHALTADNVYVSERQRTCKTCVRVRREEKKSA